VVSAEGHAIEFRRERWLALTVPEQRALLRRAIQRLRADERDANFTPLEQAVRFSRKAQPGRSCDVLGGLQLTITADVVRLSLGTFQPEAGDLPLFDSDGWFVHPWKFVVEKLAPGQWTLAEIESNPNRWRAYLDADKVPPTSLRYRVRHPGDRLQPLGMEGHRVKVSDLFINAKVDKTLREAWPLVTCFDQVVWVAGLALDERFKVTPETKTVLRLSFTKTE
jgi:tRNA(Ile)-lysidine synthase